MLLIAHAGHWALGALESVPLAAIAAVLSWRTFADRRARR
jgi:hypothetical protein